MKFLTAEEAKSRIAHTLGDDGWPVISIPKCPLRHEAFEDAPGYTYFAKARQIVAALGHFQWCLLWVSLTDVWPSNENLHLYYRVRESYGDRDQVEDRPALIAMQHEEVDLVTFVHLGMMFGWDMYLVTSHDYGRAFISHDGFFEVAGFETTDDDKSVSKQAT